MAQNDQQQPLGSARKAGGVAILIAAACSVSAPMATYFEGTVLHPYNDGFGYQSVCNGERNVPMHDYTEAQCLEMLKSEQAKQYGPEVYACSPQIAHNPFFFGAAIDAAWNAGPGAYCHSPMAKHFRVGENKQACEAFRTWDVDVHGRVVRGLQRRRDYDPMSEYHTCLKGL